jgi:hypothetical protein
MAAILVGTQVVAFFLLAKQHANAAGLLPGGKNFSAFRRYFSLERALLFAGGLVMLGSAGVVVAVVDWKLHSFGQLDTTQMMRIVVPSVTSLAVGVQIGLAAFLSGILDLQVDRS